MPQSLSSVLIHLVFSTKHRHPFITPEIERELYPYLATVFRENKCPSLKVGGYTDHIHALFVLLRTVTIAEIVEEVKKRSSKWIKRKGSEFDEFAWQAGYGAFSVSRSNVDAVKRYIENQKEHHSRQGFKTSFANYYGNMKLNTTNNMCGTDFITPFQVSLVINDVYPGRCPGLLNCAPLALYRVSDFK